MKLTEKLKKALEGYNGYSEIFKDIDVKFAITDTEDSKEGTIVHLGGKPALVVNFMKDTVKVLDKSLDMKALRAIAKKWDYKIISK